MKKLNILLLALLAGCAYEFPAPHADTYVPTAGNANLGNQDGVLADNDIVGDMDKIVGLNPPTDMSFAEGRHVYGIIGPDFNIIIDLNDARVRNFVIAFAVGSKTKAITANH